MILYEDRKNGLLAQAKDFHALSEELMEREYGLVKVKTKRGTPLKAECYHSYRRYIPDLDEWEFKHISKDAKKKKRNLKYSNWELIKPIGKEIAPHANYINHYPSVGE